MIKDGIHSICVTKNVALGHNTAQFVATRASRLGAENLCDGDQADGGTARDHDHTDTGQVRLVPW
jgi:hypothetical protein